jgi:hypothetical protein
MLCSRLFQLSYFADVDLLVPDPNLDPNTGSLVGSVEISNHLWVVGIVNVLLTVWTKVRAHWTGYFVISWCNVIVTEPECRENLITTGRSVFGMIRRPKSLCSRSWFQTLVTMIANISHWWLSSNTKPSRRNRNSLSFCILHKRDCTVCFPQVPALIVI